MWTDYYHLDFDLLSFSLNSSISTSVIYSLVNRHCLSGTSEIYTSAVSLFSSSHSMFVIIKSCISVRLYKVNSAPSNVAGMQAGDVPVTYADSEALDRDYGFTPKIGIREGLRKFAEWYKEYYKA